MKPSSETGDVTGAESRERKPRAGTSLPARRPTAAAPRRREAAERAAPAVAAGADTPLRQVLLLAGMASSVLAMIALATYTPTDASLSVTTDVPTQNLAGPLGAYLADALLQVLGYAAWSVGGVLVVCALRLARRPSQGWVGTFLVTTGIVDVAAALHMLVRAGPEAPFLPGGWVGRATGQAVISLAGQVGGGLLVATVLVAVATFLFRINWQPVAERAVARVQTGAPAAARGIGALGVGAVRATVRAGSAGLDAVRQRVSTPHDEDGGADHEADAEVQASVAADSSEPVATRLTVARRTSVSELERLDSDAGAAVGSVWSQRAAPSAIAPVDERDVPTKVAGRTLVEVEFEPTGSLPRAFDAAARPAPPQAHAAAAPLRATSAVIDPPSASVRSPLGARVDVGCPLDDAFDEVRPLDAERPLRPGGWVREARAQMGAEGADGPDGIAAPEPATRPSFLPSVAPQTNPAPSPWSAVEPEDFDVDDAVSAPHGHDRQTSQSLAPGRPPMTASASPVPPVPLVPPVVLDAAHADQRAFGPPSPAPAPLVTPEPAVHTSAVPAQRGRRGGGVAVLPGDLRSGGVTDDGRAIRDTCFQLPPLSLLDDHPAIVASTDEAALTEVARRLTQTLREFKIDGRVAAIRPGPVITMYEFEPAAGVKLSSITGLGDNIKMALRAVSVRIVAPLPGKGCVGIEVPNERRQTIWARDVFSAPEFTGVERQLPMILGKDTEGRPVVVDLARMPHLMVGGTTGAGKSVGVNAMLCSMLYMRTPEELRMILIDPKMLEFALYEDIPHLLHPVVTDAKFASAVLQWACNEMDDRYRTMARWQTRNVESYNQKVQRELQSWTPEKARMYAPKDWPEGDLLPQPRTFPYIVIVIDELAELMQVASGDVEASISRIAAKARAAGIHLILATQSPRRDVLTGVIKANMPASVAYQVRSGLDSRVILDEMGAETLLGKGDLLYRGPGTSSLTRIHGPFLSEQEVQRVADHLRAQGAPEYDTRIASAASEVAGEDEEIEYDEKYDEAVEFAVSRGSISTSMLQRHLGIGYNRAANIVETMEREGVVGPADGVKPRKVLVAQ